MTFAYDNLSRLLSVLHQVGLTTVDGSTYIYDNAGNRTSKTNQLNGITEDYTYDQIYQLTQVVQNLNTTTEAYSYDAVGNRLSTLNDSGWAYDSSNHLTSRPGVTYTYDNNGNTATKVDASGTTTYAWDYEDRLTSVTLPGSGGTVTFKYDPFGRRIQKVSPTATTNYLYDGANVIEEVDGTGTVLARYSQGPGVDQPFDVSTSGATKFYNADGLGSITSLADISASLTDTYTTDTFGNTTASSGTTRNPYRYTARDLDSETGLYYYRARNYDIDTGRFLSEDPIGTDADINFYRYTLNNPVRFTDDSGLQAGTYCFDCKGRPRQGLDTARDCCAHEPPRPSSRPSPYLPWEGYRGISASLMYKYGGDNNWGQLVRACLLCMRSRGVSPGPAHDFCYANARHRVSIADTVDLPPFSAHRIIRHRSPLRVWVLRRRTLAQFQRPTPPSSMQQTLLVFCIPDCCADAARCTRCATPRSCAARRTSSRTS